MPKQEFLRAMDDFQTVIDEFRGSMENVHHRVLTMNARVKAFDKKNHEISERLAGLREKTRELDKLAQRVEKISA